MTDLNKIILFGRITKDVGSDERSFGYVGNGQAKAEVSIAVNRSKKQNEQWIDEVSYFNILIWGKMAENLKPYLTKGTQILVEAHLKQDRWEKDGQKFSAIKIIADSVQLCGGGNRNNQNNGNNNGGNFQQNNGENNQNYNDYDDGYNGDFPEDIPFRN